MTPASRVITQLVSRQDLAQAQPSCGTGRALRSARAEIAHFHSDRSVDLHLTVRTIRRLENDLRDSTAIRLVPGSHWVTIRLECDADVDLLMTLVSVALQAHQRWPDSDDPSSARCNDHRSTALARENSR